MALHRSGKPQQNAFIVSFNGSLRDELLNEEWFDSLDDARRKQALCDMMTTTSCCDPQKRPRFWLEFSAGFSLAGQEWAAMVPDMAPEQVLEVKYETLIEEPEETLNKICLFLDVQFQPSVLEYDQNSTYSKPDAALTYQWRRKLTPER